MSYEVQVYMVGLIVICVIETIRRYWRSFRSLKSINGVLLPPGSMGLPFLGEALSLLVPSYTFDLPPFIKTRIQRYGPIFRTSIVNQPIIISSDPEVNHYILHQEGTLVELWYFDAFSKIIGLDSETHMNSLGAIHKYIRKSLLSVYGAENMKRTLLSEIEELARKTLNSWSSYGESVEIRRSFQVVLLNFVARKFIGYDAENPTLNLSEIFANVTDGFVTFPINLPGTTYIRCVQGKKKVFSLVKDMIKQKRERMSRGAEAEDVLDQLTHDMHTQSFLTENFVLHFIYGSLFASTESILSVISLTIKLLEEHPLVRKT